MAIDHSRHDERVGKIDNLHAGGRVVADALDPMIFDRDVDVVFDLARFDVEQSAGLDRDWRRSRRWSW